MRQLVSSDRMPRFSGKNGGVFRSSATPIPLDQLRQIAPSVFASEKHHSRSARFTHTATSDILDHLMKNGFNVFSVAQGGSRDESKRGFTKHMLRLRHESFTGLTHVGQTIDEIVLVNAHDGTSSEQIMAGLFRVACLNGCIVADGLLQSVRVSHSKSDAASLVLDGCIEVLRRMPAVNESVAEMRAITLTSGEQGAFARAALVARYGDDTPPVTPEQVLAVRRREDADPTLWNTFNRVQEALTRGGIGYDSTMLRDGVDRPVHRRTREIRSVDSNVGVNRALWALAEEMKKVKSGAN